MIDIIREHFWACWWLVVIVSFFFANAACDILGKR